MVERDTLLIGLGAHFFQFGGRTYVENQTISGLKAWQQNFPRVIAYGISKAEAPPRGWSDAEAEGLTDPEFELVELPDTYRLRTLRRTRLECERILLDCMQRASFRVFSYGGWIGDPGEIAAALARKHGLSHAVWLDRVESKVMRHSGEQTRIGHAKSIIKTRIVSRHENRAVQNADLALLHGATVYDHFRTRARNPHLAENIHLQAEDRISADALSEKIETLKSGPLRILYCGRAETMKGAFEWVRTLAHLKTANIAFRAEWVGEGSQLEEMKKKARDIGLSEEELSFPGFIDDRRAVLDHYRKAHVFVFCHMTEESPRNLIESLHAATPIVGFRDPYAARLVEEKGAGDLVDRGDVEGLAKVVGTLAKDRERLKALVRTAAKSASHLTRDQAFKDRSDLVRRYLGDK